MQAQQAKVLVVDDDPAIREVLQGVLEGAGYRADAAEDGPTALGRLSAGGIDLVLLDLMLPGMDGREVCRQVRVRSRGLYLPIIMVTALAAPDQRHEGFLAGADDYVTKPFAIDDVLDRVGVWLRMRERLRVAAEQRYADTEAALVLARTPLQVLLNLVRAWEAKGADTSELVPLRAELEQTVHAVSAQMDHLGRMLRDE